MKQLEKLEKYMGQQMTKLESEELTRENYSIIINVIIAISIFLGMILVVFFPATFWFIALPEVITIIIGHLIAYYIVTVLLFKNKIKIRLNNYAIKNKIKGCIRPYGGHFGFFALFGLPAYVVQGLLSLFGLISRYGFCSDFTSNVSAVYWEPFILLYTVLSLIYLNISTMIIMFFIAYIIAALVLSNPEKTGFFKYF